ncbi:MAG TPA: Tad domain-containing protein [Amnibacterium sp.]|jgi:Flp pilus assembly protein TadG
MRKHTGRSAFAPALALPRAVRLDTDARASRRAATERDGGAVAVVVAVAMVALMGAAALAVDVGALLSERAQLQNGADAASIAIAQACAANSASAACTAPTATAQSLANGNTLAGSADVRSVSVSGGTATVTLGKTVPTSFAAALGIMSKDVTASATASWGTPASGPAAVPLTFATCVFRSVPLGTAMDLYEHQIGDSSQSCTDAHNGSNLPGGFGWLDDPSGTCNLASVVSGQSFTAGSRTGNSISGACKTLFTAYLGKTVLLPVFDSVAGQGANGSYHISGWIGFQLLGWRYPGTSINTSGNAGLAISPPNTGVIGKFLGYTTLDSAFTLGPVQPGYATVVALTH